MEMYQDASGRGEVGMPILIVEWICVVLVALSLIFVPLKPDKKAEDAKEPRASDRFR